MLTGKKVCLTYIEESKFAFQDIILSKLDVKKLSQPAFTRSKLTMETLEQVVKYVQS